jgi:transposase-like protein
MELSIPRLAKKIPTEAAAYEFLEELRWEGKPICPHCGSTSDHRYLVPANGFSRETVRGKQSERRVWKCRDCKRQFSAITGTVMHGSHIPIRTWLFVIFEMVSNKNGVAAREIERRYDLHPKSAFDMLHRIREAMANSEHGLFGPVVVADETYVGGNPRNRHANDSRRHSGLGRNTGRTPVLSLIDAEGTAVRSRVIAHASIDELGAAIAENVDMGTTELHSDKWPPYEEIGKLMAAHHAVDHGNGQYVTDKSSGTNKAENYFSQLKRSLDGTHHSVSRKYLPRYLGEFDFRYTTREMSDTMRMGQLMGQVTLGHQGSR